MAPENPASVFIASWAAAAHSALRNLTPMSSSSSIAAEVYGAAEGGASPGRLPQLREEQVCRVAQELHAALSPTCLHDVQRAVLRQEEHVLVDPQDMADVRVDHAAVGDDQDVAVAARRVQHPLD